jgi:uncharacterized RDD family membrane protein YckC
LLFILNVIIKIKHAYFDTSYFFVLYLCMDVGYYILENGEKLGPFTLEELENRPLETTDKIQLPGETVFKSAFEIKEFDAYFNSEEIYYPTILNTSKFLLRLPAFLADMLIVFFSTSLLVSIIAAAFFPQYVTDPKYLEMLKTNERARLILQLSGFLILVIYNAVCECSKWQGSIGKRIFGLAVVDELGYSIPFSQAFKRNFFKIVYEVFSIFLGVFAYIGYMAMFWTERHQAIHDQFAGCFVIKKRILP